MGFRFKAVMIIAASMLLAACGGGGGGGGGTSGSGGSGGGGGGSSNQPPRFTSPTSFTFAENTFVDFTLEVTDPDSTSVTITDDTSGDGALFTVDANTGRVTANTNDGTFDFETPLDVNNDSIYEQNITLSDGTNSVTETITVSITNIDEGPVFTNAGSVDLNENQTGAIFTFTAEDPEGGQVSDFEIIEISKLGEVVNSQRLLDAFSVDPATGVLTVNTPFDAEVEGTNDPISISVSATDGTVTGSGGVQVNLIDLPARVVSGLQLTGRENRLQLGENVTAIGDLDGDTLTDFWVAENFPADFFPDEPVAVETAYIIWGSTLQRELATGVADLSLTDLQAGDVLTITNDSYVDPQGKRSQMFAVPAGDVDGDNAPDLLIGFRELRDEFDVPDAVDGPVAAVIFGGALPTLSGNTLDLTALAPANGITLTGLSRIEARQLTLSAGDFDGDGRGDILLGHPTRNQARLVFADAFTGAPLTNGTFDLSTAATDEVLLVQSLRDDGFGAIIQQVGQAVTALADVSGDGHAEAIIAGIGLEPDFDSGVYIAPSEAIIAAKADGSGVLNLLSPPAGTHIVEATGADFFIRDVAANGDIDGDGRNDIAIATEGTNGSERVAIVLYGAAAASAITLSAQIDLDAASPDDALSVLLTDQIFSQTIGTLSSIDISPNLFGGAGDELMIGLGGDSPFGRNEAGSFIVLNDLLLSGAETNQISLSNEGLLDNQGRKLAGMSANAEYGRNGFIADADGDGAPDLVFASPEASTQTAAGDFGALYVLLNADLSAALTDTEVLTYDLSDALAQEAPGGGN